MTSKDVITIENARKLKRAGIPQDSQAYWKCILASLNNIEGIAVAREEKGKMRWVLLLGKPAEEPHASAFTYEELEKIFKEKVDDSEKMPNIHLEGQVYIGTVKNQDMFITTTKQDTLALALIYYLK